MKELEENINGKESYNLPKAEWKICFIRKVTNVKQQFYVTKLCSKRSSKRQKLESSRKSLQFLANKTEKFVEEQRYPEMDNVLL